MKERWQIDVRGVVQGVGFRPFVYKLAHRLSLTGNASNSASGVSIQIEGPANDIASFLKALPVEAPALARVLDISCTQVATQQDSGFSIVESSPTGHADTFGSPDIGTCEECLAEMLDPANRRYQYPFINCTNCGPRFTITRSVPYDRSQTSMAAFILCSRCQAEYDDPLDRRFHAQPNACCDCGPRLTLLDNKRNAQPGDPLIEAIRLLRHGFIVAIKGLGGFHLAVDASQPEAVSKLRRRKHRGEKPFALMCASIEAIKQVCKVDSEEALLLESPQRPIVLLQKTASTYDALAPDGNILGICLPYTPLHHLLVGCQGVPALVMTSGNLSDEPIAIDNEDALTRLDTVADFFLVHDREILTRCDDSVVRVIGGHVQFARRSRGFVPSAILLQGSYLPILAVGGELKNTICISRGSAAFLGQHIGDLESLAAYDFFQESITHFQHTLEVRPAIIAHDLHPRYVATEWAKRQSGVSLIGVQHHHAHIAGCMAENQLSGPVIGVALDGTGYGTDGQAWGGEVLIADFEKFERAAHFGYVPMPGGAQVIREPWRMAVAYLWQAFGEDWRSRVPDSLLETIPASHLRLIEQLLRSKTRLAMTSSCGRLFDAVACMTLARTTVTYEAQAAIALEACCDPVASFKPYPFAILEGRCLQIETAPLFAALTHDLLIGVPPGVISRRFHDGLVDVLSEVVTRVARRTNLRDVCFSGGSFQNAHLLIGLTSKLADTGLRTFTNRLVPPGDGGLSFGQLVVAAHRSQAKADVTLT